MFFLELRQVDNLFIFYSINIFVSEEPFDVLKALASDGENSTPSSYLTASRPISVFDRGESEFSPLFNEPSF